MPARSFGIEHHGGTAASCSGCFRLFYLGLFGLQVLLEYALAYLEPSRYLLLASLCPFDRSHRCLPIKVYHSLDEEVNIPGAVKSTP